MYKNAASTKAVLYQLTHSGKDVVVMRSYAGFSKTEATEELVKAEHVEQGREGGVTELFYATWMLPAGKSIF